MNLQCVCLSLLLGGFAITQVREGVDVKGIAKRQVEDVNNALVKEDYAKVIDLTYPKVIELGGGREKMIGALKASMSDLKTKGFALMSNKVDDPSEPVAAGDELFIVVTYLLEMKAPGGKLLQKSFVVGISPDQGRNWTFIDGGTDVAKVRQFLPNLPERLKLPEQQPPVFEKDKS
ncbi:MAG TPA: hypothetical protein VE988_01785 [Gemmataceae bacterium]|nr:hypothetical protein [Gemmataceae bacterium]